jgi:hypothetical protein
MTKASDDLGGEFLRDAVASMKQLKRLADQAIERVDNDQLLARLDDESNSIAILMQHLSGNFVSRWTDFLTSDGEKPSRQRDTEFEPRDETTRADLVTRWERGWQVAFASLESLRPEDLGRTVVIRSEPHGVIQAIHRQLTHTAYHVGQIVFLAKHLRSADWKSLSIPRGLSEQFNEKMKARNV